MLKFKNNSDEYIFTKTIDDEDMNTRIVTRIDSIGDEINHKSNLKHDTTSGYLHKYPEFRKLTDIIESFAKECSIKRNHDHPNHKHRPDQPRWNESYIKNQSVDVMWGAVARSGQIAVPHDHWPAVWAYCYYIDPPEGCSGLHFTDMNYELPIENGLLVLFGGNVIHHTESLPFEGDRYCVSGTVVSNPPRTLS